MEIGSESLQKKSKLPPIEIVTASCDRSRDRFFFHINFQNVETSSVRGGTFTFFSECPDQPETNNSDRRHHQHLL